MNTIATSISRNDAARATSQDPRWQDVVSRNKAADGRFYYSVASTGVYCKPSCAARLARPENVRFHASTADAERAGFRPCKRCKPERFAAAADSAGRERIRYAIGPSAMGRLLVARSERGICAILPGRDGESLLADLRSRFPDADLLSDEVGLELELAAIAGFVNRPQRGLDLPLDAHGDDFQRRVWNALRDIPAGATASYGDIARRIGEPRAAREVAQACAANPLAVAIPCHRVIKSDGSLSGYRWGVARKRALLAREAQA
ncbi:methylated-DNA--[protein]-cysteine S-methyltransferase [Luteimonas gilva]|uniref:methylated-DNA--[protein]-cysteine S-methyltransferase n=1 Tax=Luteimonas gilva TaxID=2572684 RepID=A0A4U5JMH8_9GAMM|nr:methylated-DNA--[protein]-cysteine S-methyltransferase [Luteimonas gilva]TKR30385.1 methylated-DNA--[protein]-cysteine S-methyltransferase [Luteimonas gilva]